MTTSQRGCRLVIFGILMMILGCAAAISKGNIGGEVVTDGKTVTSGQVIFHSRERGIGAIAVITAEGTFKFDVPLDAGEYEVYVRPVPPEPGGPFIDNIDIPLRYRNMDTSGLKFNVIAGKNDYKIEMTKQ